MVFRIQGVRLEQASHVNQAEHRPASRVERRSCIFSGCKTGNMRGDEITGVQTGFHGIKTTGVDIDQQYASAAVEQLLGADPTYPAGTAGNYKLPSVKRVRDDVSPPELVKWLVPAVLRISEIILSYR